MVAPSSGGGVTSLHILLIPYPAQGHLIPLLDLAQELAGDEAVSITVAVTPANLPLLHPFLSTCPTAEPLVLPFSHPSIPAGVENTMDLPSAYFFDMIHAYGSLRPTLLRWARSTPTPPDAIVSDFFLGWTNALAKDLGVPRVVFSPSNALTLSQLHFLWKDLPAEVPDQDFRFSSIPGSPVMPWNRVSSLYRRYRKGEPESEFVREGFMENIRSWGFVINTFEALEEPYLSHLREDLGHRRVWAVGPIFRGVSTERGGRSTTSVEELKAWLDNRADGSVMFVCFGSQVMLDQAQTDAIAEALETSGVPFVWSTRTSANVDGCGVVPEGFRERTAKKGVVVDGWAPQVAILTHKAVGGFLTHCGWNSTVEAVVAGVTIAAWPFRADQFWNAKLVVDCMGAGVRAWEGDDGAPEPKDLAKIFRDLTDGEACVEVRSKVAELKGKGLEAIVAGGSSCRQMVDFVEELRKVKRKGKSWENVSDLNETKIHNVDSDD